MQEDIESLFPFPEADIFLHTGDLTDDGTLEELMRVNDWFGSLRPRFQHIVVIAGNHDVHGPGGRMNLKEVLFNATVLDHEVANDVLEEFGLKIYGSPWCAWKPSNNPGGEGHLFGNIPPGMDILMTHGPARRIFDTAGYSRSARGDNICCHPWGSSSDLNEAIMRAQPRVHLFGHLHEQRGVWQRTSSGNYVGGVEYEAAEGQRFPTTGPPPQDWPCDLVSCNAMCNHEGHESRATGAKAARQIAGPARLIRAIRNSEQEPWRFDALGLEQL